MKIFSGLLTTILALILLIMVFLVVSSKITGGEPSLFGIQLKTVLSGSMEPTFKTGSIIAIKPAKDPSNLKKGDVITFMVGNDKLVTHRIVDVIKDDNQLTFKTKGDNNDNSDADHVVAQNVVGKYIGITIPYAGYLIDYAKSKNGTAISLILPGLLLLGYSGFTIFRAFKEIEGSKKRDSQKLV